MVKDEDQEWVGLGSGDSVRIAEKSKLASNTRKKLVSHARKLPEPKGEAKQISNKAVQYNDGDGKVKSKMVEKNKRSNVSNNEKTTRKKERQ